MDQPSIPSTTTLRAVLALLSALCATLSGAAAFETTSAVAARLGGDAARTRLVIDLTGPAAPRVFTLANPYRVVVDLPDVTFRAETPAETARGLVSAYRFGMIADGRSRVVMDAKRPVGVDKIYTVPAADGAPARFVVELVPVSQEQFLRQLAGQAPDLAAAPARATPRAVEPSGALDRRPLIVLDPGHGGVDAGARAAGGAEEKEVVLGFSADLREKLEKTGRYRVLMTREDDSFVSLPDRVKVAHENEAELFVSIHADALSDPFGVRGATVYTLSETASDRAAALLAEKENRADLIAGVDLSDAQDEVADILIDLARRETKAFSARFARTVVGSIRNIVKLNKNPVRSAGFRVLRSPDVPSVLLELGYMSSREDLKLLTSEAWRGKAADALVAAIDGFFGARVARGTLGRAN